MSAANMHTATNTIVFDWLDNGTTSRTDVLKACAARRLTVLRSLSDLIADKPEAWEIEKGKHERLIYHRWQTGSSL
jgi:hypothetical protein